MSVAVNELIRSRFMFLMLRDRTLSGLSEMLPEIRMESSALYSPNPLMV